MDFCKQTINTEPDGLKSKKGGRGTRGYGALLGDSGSSRKVNTRVNITNLGQNTSTADIQAGFRFIIDSQRVLCPSGIHSTHLLHPGTTSSRVLYKRQVERNWGIRHKQTRREAAEPRAAQHLGSSSNTEPQRYPKSLVDPTCSDPQPVDVNRTKHFMLFSSQFRTNTLIVEIPNLVNELKRRALLATGNVTISALLQFEF